MFKQVFKCVLLNYVFLCVLVEELRKQEETGQFIQPVLFVLLVLVSVLLYFAVSLMDPGFILSDHSDLQVTNNSSVYIINLCKIEKSERAAVTVGRG